MKAFICKKCGCIESVEKVPFKQMTELPMLFDWSELKHFVKDPLCSECGPVRYKDGNPTGMGKWHGEFAKVKAEDIFGGNVPKTTVFEFGEK